VLGLTVTVLALAGGMDADRDGLNDLLEKQLLLKFAPSFRISRNDCDQQPASFANITSATKDGTIYGQVFPVQDGMIEVHYYHLWTRDCGRFSHPLDAEHVSGLLKPVDGDWKAVYWYAAAHEDTVCDAGNGAKAPSLAATERGPGVWISHGKHASYLSERLCRRGCGGDRCEEMTALIPSKIVNLGEPGAPLNGANWTGSRAWSLAAKMGSDFTGPLMAQLDGTRITDGVVSLTTPLVAMQSVILAGGATVDGLATGNRYTGAALNTAEQRTDKALAVSYKSVDNSLRKAHKATKGWLGRMW
jgi:hypothetical protein